MTDGNRTLTDEEFDASMVGYSDDQVDSLRALRRLIRTNTQLLDESVNVGRWLTGYVFYSALGQMIFAIGPKGKTKTSLHMMPYYGSALLQNRHADALATFLTGKSCLAFRQYSELPIDALSDIISRGTPVMVAMIEEHVRVKKAPRSSREKDLG